MSPLPPGSPPPEQRRALPWSAGDLWVSLGLALAAAALAAAVRLAFHPGVPIGEDIDIWSFSAANLAAWTPPKLPPGYPLLAALLHLVSGWSPLEAASWVSSVASIALAPLTWLLARRLNASRLAAGLAAVAVLATPALLFGGQEVAPEPLTAVSLLLLALAATSAVERPRPATVIPLVLASAWLFVVREHGLVAAIQVLLLLAWLPGTKRRRAARVAALLAALLLVPTLGAFYPTLPHVAPWWGKTGLVLSDAVSSDPTWTAKAGGEGTEDSLLGLSWRALGLAPLAWAWVGLALVGLLWQRRAARAAAWVALVPALPALALFSQARHVLVVVPVAAALAAAGSRRLAGGLRAGWLVGCAVLVVLAPWRNLPQQLERVRWLSVLAVDLERLGEQLCDLSDGGKAFWTGEMRPFTFCPMPHYVLEGPPGPALWKAIRASTEPLDEAWTPLPVEHDLWYFGQLRWDEPERPCAFSAPAPGSPVFNTKGLIAQLEPPCDFRPPDLGLGPKAIKPVLPER